MQNAPCLPTGEMRSDDPSVDFGTRPQSVIHHTASVAALLSGGMEAEGEVDGVGM